MSEEEIRFKSNIVSTFIGTLAAITVAFVGYHALAVLWAGTWLAFDFCVAAWRYSIDAWSCASERFAVCTPSIGQQAAIFLHVQVAFGVVWLAFGLIRRAFSKGAT